jgi:hypothetical protein
VLRKHSVLPIAYDEGQSNTLILAMADPLDMVAQDDISIITNCVIEPRIATLGEINAVLDRYFGTDEAMSAAEKIRQGARGPAPAAGGRAGRAADGAEQRPHRAAGPLHHRAGGAPESVRISTSTRWKSRSASATASTACSAKRCSTT